MFLLLKTFSYFLLPFLWVFGKWRQYGGLEPQKRFKERFGFKTILISEKSYVWFHAASVGEVVSIIPIIQKFAELYPNLRILLTTTTVTGQEMAQKRLENLCDFQFIPYDTAFGCKRFLKIWKPQLAVFVESELWPIMLKSLHEKSIPTILMNARLSKRSIKRWQQFQWIASRIFSLLDVVIVSSEQLMLHLRAFGVKKVVEKAHLKYAASPLPYSHISYEHFLPTFQTRPTWVIASTHPGEEKIALTVHQSLKQTYPDLLTVIIPRHPHRALEVKALFDKQYLKASLYCDHLDLHWVETLIVDRMGLLGLFYALSPISCVGGSLVPDVGGHNPIEPALFKNTVIWGPYTEKSEDICRTLQEAAWQVKDAGELISVLNDLWQHPEKRKDFGDKIYQIIKKNRNIIDEYINILDSYLKRPKNYHPSAPWHEVQSISASNFQPL